MAGTNLTVLHHLMATFQQMGLELPRRPGGEDLVEAPADGVDLLRPDGVAPGAPQGVVGTSLEVHVYLIFRDAAGHQLPVAAENVTAGRLHTDAVALQTVGNLRPVGLLGSHDVEGLADHGKTNQCQNYCDGEVAGHHLVTLELAHSVSLLGYIYYIWGLVCDMQQTVLVLFQGIQHVALAAFLREGA